LAFLGRTKNKGVTVATVEELRKKLEKTEKALADTKASYTKGQQILAATKAELAVLEEVGVKIPAEISKLKAEDPDKYTAELEKFNSKLTKMRQEKAEAAKQEYTQQALKEVAETSGLTIKEIKKYTPPVVYEGFEEGKIDAATLVKLAAQYKTGKPTVESPTIQKEFDFSSVTGGLLDETKAEPDKTLNPKDYII
jgi:superfamily II RNA helicase